MKLFWENINLPKISQGNKKKILITKKENKYIIKKLFPKGLYAKALYWSVL